MDDYFARRMQRTVCMTDGERDKGQPCIMDFAHLMAQVTESERASAAIIDPESWSLDKGKRSDFQVWLLNDANEADLVAGDTCCFADPKRGLFIFWWLRGREIKFEDVRSCRIDIQGQEPQTWQYYGILDGPKTCVIAGDFMTKRTYIAFQIGQERPQEPVCEPAVVEQRQATEDPSMNLLTSLLDQLRPPMA